VPEREFIAAATNEECQVPVLSAKGCIAACVTATIVEQGDAVQAIVDLSDSLHAVPVPAQVIIDPMATERAADPKVAAQATVEALADPSTSPLTASNPGQGIGALATSWEPSPPRSHRSPELPHEPGRVESAGEFNPDTFDLHGQRTDYLITTWCPDPRVENSTASPGIRLVAECFAIKDDSGYDAKLSGHGSAHGRPPEPHGQPPEPDPIKDGSDDHDIKLPRHDSAHGRPPEPDPIKDGSDDIDIKLPRSDSAHGRPPEHGPLQEDIGSTISLLAAPGGARHLPRRRVTRVNLAHLSPLADDYYEGADAFSVDVAPDAVRLIVQLALADPTGSSATPSDIETLYWHPKASGISGAVVVDYDDDYLDTGDGFGDTDEPPPLDGADDYLGPLGGYGDPSVDKAA